MTTATLYEITKEQHELAKKKLKNFNGSLKYPLMQFFPQQYHEFIPNEYKSFFTLQIAKPRRSTTYDWEFDVRTSEDGWLCYLSVYEEKGKLFVEKGIDINKKSEPGLAKSINEMFSESYKISYDDAIVFVDTKLQDAIIGKSSHEDTREYLNYMEPHDKFLHILITNFTSFMPSEEQRSKYVLPYKK